MPTISQFYGIVIRMYYDDHAPPHFHAYYGDRSAIVSIDGTQVLAGKLPKRVLALVAEWAVAHRNELSQNWERAAAHEPLSPIDPLS